jgi:hypothetical protein
VIASIAPTVGSGQPAAAALRPAGCPFHDGRATIDLLLAEIDPRDVTLFDAVLDLRSLGTSGENAGACLEQLFRIRELLEERHYLAFYRVRCWARRALRIEVRADPNGPWCSRELPLDGARLDEVINSSLAPFGYDDGVIPGGAHVRFAFAVQA